MRGRYEQPRKGRRAQKPVPKNPDPREVYQDSYENTGYSQDPYENTGYSQDPYIQNDYDSDYTRQSQYDENYDYSYQQPGYDETSQYIHQNNPDKTPDKSSKATGWFILSFIFPIIGFIIWLALKNSDPRVAKASGRGALASVSFALPIVGLILWLAFKHSDASTAKVCGKTALISFVIALVVILLTLLLLTAFRTYYDNMLDKVNIVDMTKPVYTEAATEPVITEATVETTEATEAPTTEPPTAQREDFVNILIVGQASRAKEEERFADTMLICTLNKFDNSLTVTSLLRDSFVKPPAFRGHNFGRIKLTTVYHLGSHYDDGNVAGSMELINNTLYSNFGVEIDYNVEVSFEIFEDVVNALGGVDIELNEAECAYLNDYLKHFDWAEYHVDPGMNHLDGFAGLAYARMRKAEGDGESDIKRTARQRKFMEVLMQKVKTMNVNDLQNIIEMVLPQITTNMSKSEISDMIKTVLPMLPGMEFKSGGTCPANYSGVMEDIYGEGIYHSVLKFNENETKQHMRELTLGEIPGSK